MRLKSLTLIFATLGVVFLLVQYGSSSPQVFAAGTSKPVPEFTHQNAKDWINSKPLAWKDLQGKVVLVDFWTFGCWNCYRSFPWMHELETKLKGKPFTVVGIHSPEFDHEKDRNAVGQNTKKFKLEHPVMIDNDHSYWRAIGNRYWPTYYLVDKTGNIRGVYVGETHSGDRNARAIENQIDQLLAETG